MSDIRVIIAALLLSLVAASCSNDEDVVPVPEGPMYTAGFYVTLPDVNAKTRAAEYDSGSGLENYIDLSGKDLRVVLYDLSNKYITTLSHITVTPVDGSVNRYKISGATYVDISSGHFKVMFLANWGNYPDLTAINKVWEHKYEFKSPTLANDNLIPLYGIKEVKISGGIKENEAAYLGEINLIRAFAKIEVNLVSAPAGFTVKSLQLTRYNSGGYCTPHKADSEDSYYNSVEDRYTKYVSIPEDVTTMDNLDFVRVGDTNKWVVYVPEYSNTTASDTKAQIAISFNESYYEHTNFIDFIDPSTENAIDIYRNYWYKFNITKKPEAPNVNVVVDVIDYTPIELEPSFGIPIDT